MSAAVTPAPFVVRALVVAGAIALAAVLVVRAQRQSASVPAPTAAEPATTPEPVADVGALPDSTATPDGQDPNRPPALLFSSKSGPPALDPLLAEPAPVFFLPSSKVRGVDPSFLGSSKSLNWTESPNPPSLTFPPLEIETKPIGP